MSVKCIRVMIWCNFIVAAFHTADTVFGIHTPLFQPTIDWAIHSVGLFLWGTIALYGPRAREEIDQL